MIAIAMNDSEEHIWKWLMDILKNPIGSAAIMGNLKAESGMDPTNMTGENKKEWNSPEDYVYVINTGSLSREEFAHDGIAFGLAQWCYWSRKEALYDFARGLDISDSSVQIAFMLDELPKYKTVWTALKESKSIREASDIFMLKYEKPANTSESMKERRAQYAREYYERYFSGGDSQDTSNVIAIRTTANRVLVRCGNGKNYTAITRIEKSGSEQPYVATAKNGWHAIAIGNRVGWISPEFSETVKG